MIASLDVSVVVPLIKAEGSSRQLQAFLDGLDDELHLLVSGRLLEAQADAMVTQEARLERACRTEGLALLAIDEVP